MDAGAAIDFPGEFWQNKITFFFRWLFTGLVYTKPIITPPPHPHLGLLVQNVSVKRHPVQVFQVHEAWGLEGIPIYQFEQRKRLCFQLGLLKLENFKHIFILWHFAHCPQTPSDTRTTIINTEMWWQNSHLLWGSCLAGETSRVWHRWLPL